MGETVSLKAEFLYGTDWTDVSSDVLDDEPVRIKYGIFGFSPFNLVAGEGVAELSMDNGTSVPAGRYTPGHASADTDFGFVPARLTLTANGESIQKFRGTIGKILPESGAFGERKTVVRASDWIGFFAQESVRYVDVQINKTGDELLEILYPSVFASDTGFADLDVGQSTFEFAFDEFRTNRTTVLQAIKNICASEMGQLSPIGSSDGYKIRFFNSLSWVSTTDVLMQLDNDGDLIDDFESLSVDQEYWRDRQIAVGRVFPRAVSDSDSPEVLWSLSGDGEVIAAGATTILNAPYRDPTNPDVRVSGIEFWGAEGRNQIANKDFETDASGWTAVGSGPELITTPTIESAIGEWDDDVGNCAVTRSADQAHSGSWSAKAVTSAAGAAFFGANVSSAYGVSAGATYSASFWVRSSVPYAALYLYLIEWTGAGVYVTEGIKATGSSATGAWTQITASFSVSGTTGKVSVKPLWIAGAASEVVYVDDISLLAGTTAPTIARSTAQHHDGVASLLLNSGNHNPVTPEAKSDAITGFVQNDVVNVQAWVYTTDAWPADILLYVSEYNSSHVLQATQTAATYQSTDSGWIRLAGIITLSDSDTSEICVRVAIASAQDYSGGAKILYVDQVYVIDGTEFLFTFSGGNDKIDMSGSVIAGDAAELHFKNTSASQGTLTDANVKGRKLSVYEPIELYPTGKDPTNMPTQAISMTYQDSVAEGQDGIDFAQTQITRTVPWPQMVGFTANTSSDLMHAALYGEPGTKIVIDDPITGLELVPCVITGVELELENGRLDVTWAIFPAQAIAFFYLDDSVLDGTDVLAF